MEPSPHTIQNDLRKLIDENRLRCLWFMRQDYYPETTAEALRTLDYVQRRCDLETFRRAGKIKQWLLQNSSEASAK